MTKKIFSFAIIIGLLCSFSIKAQSLDETLSRLSSTVGKAYVNPVISAFGSNLNSGWVSQFPGATKLGFHIDLKIVAMGSFFSKDVKNFTSSGTFNFNSDETDKLLQNSNYTPATIGQQNYNTLKQTIMNTPLDVSFNGPTIIGSKNDYLKVNFPGKTITSGQTQYTVNPYTLSVTDVKGFLDEIPALPTATAQLTVGTIMGTNVAVRYFPEVNIKDMGKFTFWGIGIVHNPAVWLVNPLPVDISIAYFYQKLKVGSIFETNASQVGVYASKTFGSTVSITPYFGLTTETSKTNVKYNYHFISTIGNTQVESKAQIAFESEGQNTGSAVVGFNLHLAAVNINADYKMAKTNTLSAGISFGF